jgi:hypothetical protein
MRLSLASAGALAASQRLQRVIREAAGDERSPIRRLAEQRRGLDQGGGEGGSIKYSVPELGGPELG